MTTQEVLKEARRLLAEVGWCQYYSCERDETGTITAYCSIGAVYAAAGTDFSGPFRDAKRLLERQIPYAARWCGVAGWNDTKGRTKREVLALFDRALAALPTEPA